MTNAEAVEATIIALAADGRLGDADAALIAMARTAAQALDVDPGNAALLREYRQTLVALMSSGSGDGDEDTQAFLLAVRTPVLHTAPARAADDGGRRRTRGDGTGSAVDAVAKAGRGRRPRAST